MGKKQSLNSNFMFESKNQYQVTVNVQDLSLGEDVFASSDFSLNILDVNEAPIENLEIADRTLQEGEALNFSIAEDTFIDPDGDTLFYSAFLEDGTTVLPSWLNFDNEAPTAVNLSNTITELAENSEVGIGIKVADITIIDDALGTNELSLTGANADSFAIIGTELFYISASPDFETKNQYQVTVNVDDETVGATPDATVNFTLAITDIPDSIDTLLNDNIYRFRTARNRYLPSQQQ